MQGKIFIIAEAGVNHNGDLNLAQKLIDAAVEAGADAVKFQCFKADRLVTRDAAKAAYQTANLGGAGLSQHQMLKALELRDDDFRILKEDCDRKKICFLATPFDEEAVDLLEPLVDRYKISSGDCTNLPFLQVVAKKGKPVILSTGMSSLDEVRQAVKALEGVETTLLHCTTNYPCPPKEANLRAMLTLKKEFGLPVGFSDHTEGIEIAVAAAALGATVIEKHFTLDKKMKGPDHRASLEPNELKEMIHAIRTVEAALGDGIKRPQSSELEIRRQAARSLVAARDLKAGEILREEDFVCKRPGTGIPPDQSGKVIGKRLKKPLKRDDLITFEVLEG
jgi:N-acetylneuraminate synthase/N,N'-diacetyllegionaminate synthase